MSMCYKCFRFLPVEVLMTRTQWRDFRTRYPALAETLFELGTHLYEMGVDRARESDTLTRLMALLNGASPDVRTALGCSGGNVTRDEALRHIVEYGSTNLLDYLRSAK